MTRLSEDQRAGRRLRDRERYEGEMKEGETERDGGRRK